MFNTAFAARSSEACESRMGSRAGTSPETGMNDGSSGVVCPLGLGNHKTPVP